MGDFEYEIEHEGEGVGDLEVKGDLEYEVEARSSRGDLEYEIERETCNMRTRREDVDQKENADIKQADDIEKEYANHGAKK